MRADSGAACCLWNPICKSYLGGAGLRIDDRLHFGVDQDGLCPDPKVSAGASLPGQIYELLRILRRIEQLTELLYLLAVEDVRGLFFHGFIPFRKRQL